MRLIQSFRLDHIVMEPWCEHRKLTVLVGYATVIAGYIRASVKITKFTSSRRPICQDYLYLQSA